jgi:hypothetical protein
MAVEKRSRPASYLRVAFALFAVASLVLLAAPNVGAGAFSLLIYQDPDWPADFSAEAQSYIRLTNAVLGAVMAGWFTTMFLLVDRLGRSHTVWLSVVVGLLVWFVPDSLYSLASGYWENAILNLVILALLLPALVVSRPPRGDSPVRMSGG